MSDLLNPTFGDEDDGFLSFGDEDLSEVSGASEATVSAEAQPADQAKVEEILFPITGEDGKEQQVPFGKLTPQLVKQWHDDHLNKHNWNKSNTDKAAQLAEERRAFDGEKQQFATAHQEYERWIGFFKANEGLQETVSAFVTNPGFRALATAYVQGRIPQALLTQILGQQPGQQNANVQPISGYDPHLNNVVQRLAILEQQLKKDQEARLQDQQLSAREKAMQTILPLIPEDRREAFKQYMEQVTAGMTDLSAMYKLIADSFLWTNRDELIKKMQQQAIEDQKKKQNAGVEMGVQQAAVTLPTNVDVSGTRDIGHIFEQLADSLES